MTFSYANMSSATGTSIRVRDASPFSGMCPICIKECNVLCQIGKAALRGREVLYPVPEEFGTSTAASNKDYALDWSHFQILSGLIGAEGIEEDPDKAIFPAVDISTSIGGVPLKVPVFTAALGSTQVAFNFWSELAIGAAISGTVQLIGENVVGMDMQARFNNGKVNHSDDLKYRVDKYREFWDGKHGDIAVQTNVEDQRLGVCEYALSKLEVNIIERKWGQGAKSIGGEVRIYDLDKAIELKQRGYLVIPDPTDEVVQNAFRGGVFKSFERHSKVGFPVLDDFVEDVERLREQGAKHVFLKTGAYRPSATAFTMKAVSEAKVDLVTFDGAGGGTGMSPVPMMNECSTPTVYLEAQVLKCIEILKKAGKHVPDIAFAGGFVNPPQIFKSIAMSNLGNGPHIKAIAMARAPITAAMKSTYFKELADEGRLPKSFAENYGTRPEQFFILIEELENEFGERSRDIPMGAIGIYTYFHDYLGVGLKQLMAGSRKFRLDLLNRDDLASISEIAERVTGIPFIMDAEAEVMERILE